MFARWAVAAGGCALGLIPGCSGPPAPSARPNVVLISIDTLRADRLASGGPCAVLPRIGEFARQAVVLEACRSEASHTLLAHATLLTGTVPETHGVLDAEDVLPPAIPTLAELLRVRGYDTGAVVNCGYFDRKFALDRGFAVWDYRHDRQEAAPDSAGSFGRGAEETNRAVLDWLDGRPAEPWFLFVHYYDVHSDWADAPYEAPAEFIRRLAGPAPPEFRTGDGEVAASLYLLRADERGEAWSPEHLAHLAALYDAGAAYTDAQVGHLLDRLRRDGLLERSIVVLTSDHGEEFREHRRFLHAQVYEELTRVPLIVSAPGLAAGRRTGLAQLADVAPTVLDWLGLEPPPGMQGRSLRPLIERGEPVRDLAFSRNEDGSQYALTDGRHKLVVEERADRRARLFDLGADPREAHDLAAREPERVRELLARLDLWRGATRAAAPGAPPPVPLDPRTRRRLEALGYVGGRGN